MQDAVHIFLADDDADDRAIFYEAIRVSFAKAKLTSATNGEELLKVLKEIKTSLPRLVFLDLNMPVKNGHETLIDIRKDDTLKAIPVIIYSTSHDVKDIDKSFYEGADFYITKPTSFSDLKYIMEGLAKLNRKTHLPTAKESFILKTAEGKS